MAQSIQGTVTDSDGNGLARATVTVTDEATGDQEAQTLTDNTGSYSVSVSASTYDVLGEKPSYQDDEVTSVTVQTDQTKTVDLTLPEFQPKAIGRRSNTGSIGVLAEATATTGAQVALKSSVDTADGWGLVTAYALRIGGLVDTDGDDFVVETGTVLDGRPGNVVVGHASNSVGSNVDTATIAGGGRDDGSNTFPNTVTGNFGTIGGGYGNTADSSATVSGGDINRALGISSTIGGGNNNTASEARTTVGGGKNNTADYTNATVSGGIGNSASDNNATVGGGFNNMAASGRATTVAGGTSNCAKAAYGAVGGGKRNAIRADSSTIGGGVDNAATSGSTSATISGGTSNAVTAAKGTVGGGILNTASEPAATVSGGEDNTASGEDSTVGGGTGNTSSEFYTTVAGGLNNTASAPVATVAGGDEITASGSYSAVAGGEKNEAIASYAAIGGGFGNHATGTSSTIGGGARNGAHGTDSTVGGGDGNRVGQSGTTLGQYGTIPGGRSNVATGDYSFAAGREAEATDEGTFVWSDSTSGAVTSTISNSFIVSAGGGVGINETNPRTQLHVTNKSPSSTLESHTALIEDTNSASSRALAVKIGDSSPTDVDHYITFYDAGDNYQGAIEGDGNDGVQLDGTTADYGEYIPKRDADGDIQPADVVGVVDGAITKQTDEADQALVVSDRSIVTGNSPGPDPADREDHEVCAFVGQVPVTVRGAVDSGDLIVPSGEHDGTARALSPQDWTPGDGPLVGRAWETTDEDDISEVTVAVGLETGEALEAAFIRQRKRVDQLEAENQTLRDENQTLRDENDSLRNRLATVESHLGIEADGTPTPADD